MKREPPHLRPGRIEPTADWSGTIEGPAARVPGPAVAPAGARVWRWLAALLLVMAGAVVLLRQPISERLWPDTRVQQLLQQGEEALARGVLTAADGSGARQRFEAAQALDEDRSEARDGLARVGQQALAQASSALGQGDLERARAAVSLAQALQVPRAQSDALDQALRAQESDRAGVARLLQQALQAHGAGLLDDPPPGAAADGEAGAVMRGALPLFGEVLELDPGNDTALEGREDALAEWLQRARRVLAAGDLAGAAAMIERARLFDPGHIDFPDTQALLTRALDQRLRAAERDLARGRLESARDGFAGLRALVPEIPEAAQGLAQVATAYAARAARHAGEFEFDQAESMLALARDTAPGVAAVGAAERALAAARQSQARLGSRVPAAQRQQRVQVLLQEMARAEARGDWILPPGDSAFDKLRAAQALLPQHPTVRRAAARLLPATRACFEDEMRANRIARARGCHDAWRALDPGDAALADARTRLAQKWVAVGTEQLGAGDVAFARRALGEARALDASAPGLSAFEQRVRTASGVEP